MNYATWQLNFQDPNHGTGPEDAIAALGFSAEGAWLQGSVETNGTILGYVTESVDESEFATWHWKNITEVEALDFCLAINPEAYLINDGRIIAPLKEQRA